jgi:hypothetical protein
MSARVILPVHSKLSASDVKLSASDVLVAQTVSHDDAVRLGPEITRRNP